MKALASFFWRIFWTGAVALGIVTAAFRVDRVRTESARTDWVTTHSAQIFAQFELLTAPGTLQTSDRLNRAAAILNTGPEHKPMTARIRVALTEEPPADIRWNTQNVIWSRRIPASSDRVLELTWNLPAPYAFGATAAHDADLRLVLLFLGSFFLLWALGRKLFAKPGA